MPPSISPTTVQAENGIAHAHPSIPVEEVMRLSAAIDQVQTEDDQPVDNSLSERQMRLLVETLYDSWQPMTESGQPRRFYAQANVGVFYAVNVSPIVPDVMLVMDITVPEGYESKSDLSYFAWNYGKVPDVAIEIVSNKEGGEDTDKMQTYAFIGVGYYVVFDPLQRLSDTPLRIFCLRNSRYELQQESFLPHIGLGLMLWPGEYEDRTGNWLRWCDASGSLLTTGTERANNEAERANREAGRANREAGRANREAGRAEQLAAKLRELGVDPDKL